MNCLPTYTPKCIFILNYAIYFMLKQNDAINNRFSFLKFFLPRNKKENENQGFFEKEEERVETYTWNESNKLKSLKFNHILNKTN